VQLAEREAIGLLKTGPEMRGFVSRLNLYLANKPYREQIFHTDADRKE
jgi:hypothetical protein